MKLLLLTLWKNISPKRKRQAISLILFSILTSIFEVFTVGATFNLISYFTTIDSNSALVTSYDFKTVLNLDYKSDNVFILFLIFLILACVCRLILLWSMLRFSHTVGNDMGIIMFSKILKQPMEFHFSSTTSEIISSLTKKIHILSLEIVHPIILVCSNIIIISAVIGYLLYNTGIQVLLPFCLLIFVFYIFWKVSKSSILKNSQIISINSDLLIKIISETMHAIKLILMKQTYTIFTDKFGATNRKLKFAEGDNVFLSQSIRIWLELFIIIFGTVFCFITIKSGAFISILPLLGGLVFGVYRIIPLVLKAYSGFATIMGATESFKDILNFLLLKEVDVKDNNNIKKINFINKIFLRNLFYNYPSKKNSSIVGINCFIEKNKITGILGTTGSGKTTLVSLIAGLIKPSKGELIIDGQPLNNDNKYIWQNKISFVPQETIIVDGSISDNILLILNKKNNKQKLIQSLKLAKLDKFIPHLDSEDIMGERGVKISGGERQRIGLARAIYDEKEIIILDEPFSALDKYIAKEILLNIKNLNKFTIIIVTHDQFVVPFCDKLITLEEGRLVQS